MLSSASGLGKHATHGLLVDDAESLGNLGDHDIIESVADLRAAEDNPGDLPALFDFDGCEIHVFSPTCHCEEVRPGPTKQSHCIFHEIATSRHRMSGRAMTRFISGARRTLSCATESSLSLSQIRPGRFTPALVRGRASTETGGGGNGATSLMPPSGPHKAGPPLPCAGRGGRCGPHGPSSPHGKPRPLQWGA